MLIVVTCACSSAPFLFLSHFPQARLCWRLTLAKKKSRPESTPYRVCEDVRENSFLEAKAGTNVTYKNCGITAKAIGIEDQVSVRYDRNVLADWEVVRKF